MFAVISLLINMDQQKQDLIQINQSLHMFSSCVYTKNEFQSILSISFFDPGKIYNIYFILKLNIYLCNNLNNIIYIRIIFIQSILYKCNYKCNINYKL